MLCVIHVKHDSEDKQVGYWQFGCPSCMRNKIAALRAENERLKADNLDLINTLEAEGFHNEAAAIRIAELEAALGETIEEVNEALPYIIDGTPENELVGWRKRHVACAREVLCRAAAALKEAE